jgi:nicotinamidase-related amidase
MTDFEMTEDSALFLIDIQEKLLKGMPRKAVKPFVKYLDILIEIAGDIGADIYYTEQYPDGLGETAEPIRRKFSDLDATSFEKVEFNACEAPSVATSLDELPDDIYLCGMEAHICVLLTARHLVSRGHDVQVPFDAVISRRKSYKDNGLELIEDAGAAVTNTETIVFDTLGSAEADNFGKFSEMIK